MHFKKAMNWLNLMSMTVYTTSQVSCNQYGQNRKACLRATQSMHTTYELNSAYFLCLQYLQCAASLHCAGGCNIKTTVCVCIEFCTSLYQCALAHQCAAQIDWGVRLEPHGFEPGQADNSETAFFHPYNFKVVWTASKKVQYHPDSFKEGWWF